MIGRSGKIPDGNPDETDDHGVGLFDPQDQNDDHGGVNDEATSKTPRNVEYLVSIIIIIAFILVACSILSPLGGKLFDKTSDSSSSSSSYVSKKHYDASTPFVEDNAKVLSRETDESISNLNDNLKSVDGSPEILVVTVKTLDGAAISTFAADKGNQYGIGSKDENNGLVYVLDVDENQDFLATGYGMEDKITDVIATNLLDDDSIHDDYKSGDYDSGVQKVMSKVSPYLHGNYSVQDLKRQEGAIDKSDDSSSGANALVLFILFVMVFIINPIIWLFGLFGRRRRGHGWFGGMSSSGGGSSGGGGWSGGGGSFGGGGGGSSW